MIIGIVAELLRKAYTQFPDYEANCTLQQAEFMTYRVPARQFRDDAFDTDLWERGLQLAHFIYPVRAVALEILRDSLTKLDVQRDREYKRGYWRDKNLKTKIRRITREQGDALQWLIYLESEPHEKCQEHAGSQTVDDMVLRYIKHLAEITTAMSSLYVQIGFQRLLHDYSTPEVRQVYESITGHQPGYAEYRKVKGMLLEKLHTRFKDFLRVYAGERRELRFEACEDQQAWADFVDECLTMFIPWSTVHNCPTITNLGSNWRQLVKFLATLDRLEHQDSRETKHCHVFIDPVCYTEITRTLGIDHRHKRLAIPKFFLNAESNGGRNLRNLEGESRSLSEEERTALTQHLHTQARLRQQISPKLLTIMAHGAVYGKLDLTRSRVHSFEIREGIKLIEIWGEDETSKVLFAAYSIRYRRWQGIARQSAVLPCGPKRQLRLRIIPQPSTEESAGALVQVKFGPSGLLARAEDWITLLDVWSNWPRYAVAGLLLVAGLAMGWIAAKSTFGPQLTARNAQIQQLTKDLAALHGKPGPNGIKAPPRGPSVSVPSVNVTTPTLISRLRPDTTPIREHGEGEHVVSISPGTTLLLLELPVYEQPGTIYRATLSGFLESREIISEDGLTAVQVDGQPVVTFSLPTSLVHNSGDYILHLRARDSSGHLDRVLNFTFYIEIK
jgi:hypothetical protein